MEMRRFSEAKQWECIIVILFINGRLELSVDSANSRFTYMSSGTLDFGIRQC